MMQRCSLCGKQADIVHIEAEQYILDVIKKDHPEWVNKNGSCKACMDYYKKLDDIKVIE